MSAITWHPWDAFHVDSECGEYRISTWFGLHEGMLVDRYRAWYRGEPIGTYTEIDDADGACEAHKQQQGEAR